MSIPTIQRYRGSILGLATGDAIGTTVEFQPPGSFQPVTDMIGGGVFQLEPGQWTDDTSMALCLAESLIQCQGFNLVDQLTRYCRWYRDGYFSCKDHCFDIGHTTRTALHAFELSGQPDAPTDPYTAGNGSLMRLAPVPLFYSRQIEDAIYFSAQSSITTHAAPNAIDACRYYASLIVGAIDGQNKANLLADTYLADYWRSESLSAEIEQVRLGSFKTKQPPQIVGSGYVVESLEAALWAFEHSDSFEQGTLMAVNLGDDADTTGAIYGQLAGAYYGEIGIPVHWREQLAFKQQIETMADQLYHLAWSGQ